MARQDITMTPAEIEAFIRSGRIAHVATLGDDGWPHLVPMWYVVEDGLSDTQRRVAALADGMRRCTNCAFEVHREDNLGYGDQNIH